MTKINPNVLVSENFLKIIDKEYSGPFASSAYDMRNPPDPKSIESLVFSVKETLRKKEFKVVLKILSKFSNISTFRLNLSKMPNYFFPVLVAARKNSTTLIKVLIMEKVFFQGTKINSMYLLFKYINKNSNLDYLCFDLDWSVERIQLKQTFHILSRKTTTFQIFCI
eukprot:snap_masked-scaffold_8-processed-gene-0.18-mRNA-1 protein AED:1.00 eAED:1.00 QI:0/0/0/0/1/1/2/0/166